MKKRGSIVLVLLIGQLASYGQSYNNERTSLSQFITRMYKAAPFTGVKVFRDYEHTYLISLVKLPKSAYPSESVIDRVAEVKARAQVNQFMNGSYISTSSVITIPAEDGKKKSQPPVEDINEIIKENSIGYVDAVEQIACFTDEQETDKKVFIFLRELEKTNKKKSNK
jgi:hypothetical protein